MDAYIYDAVRTPRGAARKTGALVSITPINLLSQLFSSLHKRQQWDQELVEDIVLGCVTQVNDQGANIAKIAAIAANLPESIAGITVNRFCSSALDAVGIAAQKTNAGSEHIVLAGGIESISRVPMFADNGAWYRDPEVSKKTNFIQMGVSADIIATLEKFERQQLDEYAIQSHERAAFARRNQYFSNSIVPIYDTENNIVLENDELIRENSTVGSLAQLVPVFGKVGAGLAEEAIYRDFPQLDGKINHLHHPGNSPSLADGASLLLIGNKQAEEKLGIRPRARIVAVTSASTNPLLLTGGQTATEKILAKTDFSVDDIDLFEYNESFAATVLKYMRDLGINENKLNVNGGVIATGHAMGATGGMLIITLLDELERKNLQRGLVAISGGGGVGTAMIIERV
ncbi:acetyl-CoA C-acyltransferase [Pueribacillus theae]|uniref:Acetyl-CoA C-acyltransferase n=1 Tax=Pueribacillus theae TaxID=2171751 RepID=A0A2U1JX70_9BACI|nr:acetyl-CoA C-acyltransferase [Pueribacillus theae]PWA09423.1 acetyl-CoA C-acyltransferase [Pueribacillus theae]